MISREKYLLTVLAEEAAEIAQRASKAIRFGLQEVQPGQERNNQDRLIDEIDDLLAVIEMLNVEFGVHRAVDWNRRAAKKEKVEKFYTYSRELGEVR